MKTSKRLLGDRGEEIACHWYQNYGYEIVDRNVNVARVGEIDIIAVKEINGVSTFAFIEVKTRSSTRYGNGFEAISFAKKIRMRSCAMVWLESNGFYSNNYCAWRLDVASVSFDGGVPRVTVIENIET